VAFGGVDVGGSGFCAVETGAKEIVMKAQVFAGGRGKGTFSNGFKGGVQLSTDPVAIGTMAGQMLGQTLVTKQTPPGGVPVNFVSVSFDCCNKVLVVCRLVVVSGVACCLD
jgi:succinyl-CoA synthetase beta subunit